MGKREHGVSFILDVPALLDVDRGPAGTVTDAAAS
jgi:hypothetical protein